MSNEMGSWTGFSVSPPKYLYSSCFDLHSFRWTYFDLCSPESIWLSQFGNRVKLSHSLSKLCLFPAFTLVLLVFPVPSKLIWSFSLLRLGKSFTSTKPNSVFSTVIKSCQINPQLVSFWLFSTLHGGHVFDILGVWKHDFGSFVSHRPFFWPTTCTHKWWSLLHLHILSPLLPRPLFRLASVFK